MVACRVAFLESAGNIQQVLEMDEIGGQKRKFDFEVLVIIEATGYAVY